MKRFEPSYGGNNGLAYLEPDSDGVAIMHQEVPIDAIRTLISFAYSEGCHIKATKEVTAWLEAK